VNPNLLLILLQEVGIPELTAWLQSRGSAPLTDADVIKKLATDTAIGEQIGQAWLAAHPVTPPASS